MSNEPLNIAFVGCGRIADLHVPAYRDNDKARIFALCDTDDDTLARRKEEWGPQKTYTSFDALLADRDVDALEILTPQPLHERQVIEALRAGKHVAVQKPMTIDLASADRMLAAARSVDKVFKVTDNYVFYPPIVQARKLIDDGAIGDPIHVRIQYVSGPEGGWDVPAQAWVWRLEEAKAGRGPTTFDHGHHLWSTAWFLLGEVERVVGWIDSSDGIIDTPALFMWKYRDGVRYGTCQMIHAERMRVPSKYYSNDEWIEVQGTKGILFIRRCTGLIHEGPVLSLFDGTEMRHFDIESDWVAGFVGSGHNFVSAIRGEAPARLSGDEGREVLRFALALQRSARLRREVYLDELDRRVPSGYAFARRQWELRRGLLDVDLLGRLGFGVSAKELAPRAVALTEELVARFDPGEQVIPDTSIGLILRGDELPEQKLTLVIEDNHARLELGAVASDAKLVVTMKPSTWAAILSGKKRVESAVLQGQLSFTGRAEEALHLRDAFKI